ncbi:hypothetical protein [Patulibacter americanus]|uniref:hypothetical protein n=1 Tax=Patulibacter americanus TaxID=588672 RepID=UPI0003B53540|nr:hypothetical protein [Patulibacter americanus]
MFSSVPRTAGARPAVPDSLRRRRRVLATALAVAVLPTTPASADVLRFTYGEGDDGTSEPVLIRPDGARVTLAPFPEPPKSSGPRPAAVDPTRRFVARILGTRIAVLPLDGSPTRVVRTPGVRAAEDASAWWSADGSVLTAGPVRTPDGAAAVRRCTMPALECTVVRTGRWVTVGGAPGGGTLLTRDGARGTAGRIARDTDGEWHPRSAAWVRRTRALLNRPLPDALRLDRGDGTPARTLWRSARPLAERTTTIEPLAPTGEASGALLQWADSRVALSIRRRDGVLSARLSPVRLYAAGYWQVTADGRRRSLGRLASTPTVPQFPTPDGDWVALLDPLTKYGDHRLGTVTADGAVRSLTVGGRRVTWRNLHTALGLPRSTRLPVPNPDFGPDQYEWVPFGVEAATRSVVVLTADRRDAVILARVSLDGARPTIVDRQRTFDLTEVLVW